MNIANQFDINSIDTAGIGDTCLVYFKTQLKADVVVPVILALDIDFGQLNTSNKIKDVVIRNIGSDDLQITGYSIPSDTVFKQINWPLASAQNPLIVKPSESLQLPIMFMPDRQGEWHNRIIFQSDSYGYKNYVDLSGSAVITAIENDSPMYGFNITPNPASENFTITYPKPVDIIIRDMLGHSVFRTTFEGRIVVPTYDFSTGIYFVEMLERNGTQRFEKIVVQK